MMELKHISVKFEPALRKNLYNVIINFNLVKKFVSQFPVALNNHGEEKWWSYNLIHENL